MSVLSDPLQYPQIPLGPTTVKVGSEEFQFRFVKVAVNVATQPGEKGNVLAEILRELFGENAGAAGTRQFVRFRERDDGVWEMVKG